MPPKSQIWRGLYRGTKGTDANFVAQRVKAQSYKHSTQYTPHFSYLPLS